MEDVPSKSLLIVGPGVLGSYLGKMWKDKYPDARVVGQTNTDSNHAKLEALGLEVRTKAEADNSKFAFVAFAAPPSGSDDYANEVAMAATHWDGSGAMLFTSSVGVYDVKSGPCAEDSPVAERGASARTDRLLAAEDAMLAAGGNVVRYVGLYHLHRGAHTFFLAKGAVDRNADSVINLIHYEDAARFAAAVLEGSGSQGLYRQQVFLAADKAPCTFKEMMQACKESGAFEGDVTFTGQHAASGKVVDASKSRNRLAWEPKHSSFRAFMLADGGPKDFYSELEARINANT